MNYSRLRILTLTLLACFFLVIGRFFYWQIIKYDDLHQKVISQNYKTVTFNAVRGQIFDSQNNPLAINQDFYQLSIYKPDLKTSPDNIINQIKTFDQPLVKSFFNNSNQKWLTTTQLYSYSEKNQFNDPGISFTTINQRFYPENPIASLIIGTPNLGGLENYYQKQLSGKTGFGWVNQDAVGQTLLNHSGWQVDPINGRDLHTSINRQIQFLIETALKNGIEKYTADSGSISIMSPQTGEIIAMANFEASPSAYPRNPIISNLFEPGSIFKPLVVSIALDTKTIDTDYICDKCGSPHQIGQYSISNWDNSLHPNSSLQDIIKNSDNIGMSYIIARLGLSNFLHYFKLLGLDRKTGIDLQGETKPLTKNFTPEIDFATASFGQGFAITQIQMLTAFNTIANNGLMVQPHLVKYFTDLNGNIKGNDSSPTQVYQPETISKMKKILKYAVENGVVAKFKPNNLEVCAKSGTAQIAINGKYSDSTTIASYIGFSPCQNPQYTMIVTINNPRTSPWGSSTAAPIWYEIASKLEPLL